MMILPRAALHTLKSGPVYNVSVVSMKLCLSVAYLQAVVVVACLWTSLTSVY